MSDERERARYRGGYIDVIVTLTGTEVRRAHREDRVADRLGWVQNDAKDYSVRVTHLISEAKNSIDRYISSVELKKYRAREVADLLARGIAGAS